VLKIILVDALHVINFFDIFLKNHSCRLLCACSFKALATGEEIVRGTYVICQGLDIKE
jgi:hypothetical protein